MGCPDHSARMGGEAAGEAPGSQATPCGGCASERPALRSRQRPCKVTLKAEEEDWRKFLNKELARLELDLHLLRVLSESRVIMESRVHAAAPGRSRRRFSSTNRVVGVPVAHRMLLPLFPRRSHMFRLQAVWWTCQSRDRLLAAHVVDGGPTDSVHQQSGGYGSREMVSAPTHEGLNAVAHHGTQSLRLFGRLRM